MFVVKQDQIEAFRLPMREAARDRLIENLDSDSVTVSGDKSTITQTDEYGNQTTLSYSSDVLPTTITKLSGIQYSLSYDRNGRLSSLQYPDGGRLQFRFENGQLQQVAASPEKQYQFEYTKGLLSRVVYPGQKNQRFVYNDFGDLLSLTDRTGQTTEYIRAPDGQLQTLKDPLNRQLRFQYDENALLSDLIFPDQTKQSYLYDEDADTLYVRLRDGKGFSQQYENSAITELTWEDGPVTHFTYNTQQQPTQIDSAAVSVAFTYDDQQRLSTEAGPHGFTSFEYDQTSRPNQLLLSTGTSIRYEYDTDSRVTALHVHGQTVRFIYDNRDLLAEIQYPNGLTEYQRRSHTEGLSQVQVRRTSGETLSEQTYGYDSWDRLTQYQDTSAQQALRFAYDDESRLTGVGDDRARRYLERFTYDVKGNLDQHNGQQVWVGHMDEIRRIGNQSISYDALGNIIRLTAPKGDIRCRFARNSTLTSVQIGDSTWQYEYDGIGRRTRKTDGVQAWQYIWAGSQLVVETFWQTPTSSPLVREYVYLPDSQVPVAFHEAGQLYWLQADVRGAITHVFDESGTVVWQALYSAFGEITILQAQVRQPWRLMGQYEDDETGLYYNLARYYAPWLTTYLSLDPLWIDHNQSNYSYCQNNPYNLVDPLGLSGNENTGWSLGSMVRHTVGFVANMAISEVGELAGAALGGEGGAAAGFAIGMMLGGPVGAIIGVVIGEAIGIYAGKVAGSGIGSFVGTIAEQLINGEPISLSCAWEEAKSSIVMTAAGPILGTIERKVSGKLSKVVGNTSKKVFATLRRIRKAKRTKLNKAGEIRRWYNSRVSKIGKLNKKWIDEGVTLEERSKRASNIRHDARMKARARMKESGMTREEVLLRKRDMKKYGNPDGPAYDQALKRSKEKAAERGLSGREADVFAHEDVIRSSQRTDEGYNKLQSQSSDTSTSSRPLPLP